MSGFSDLRAPDEGGARARAWGAIAAEPLPTRHRSLAPMIAAAVAALLALALALTPPGDAVATWVKRAVGVERARPKPTGLEQVPGGGRVAALAPDLWVAGSGLAPRRVLGGVDQATWSPHGLYLAAVRAQRELLGVDLDGHLRWRVAPRAGRVRAPAWSPDGFRVAYLAGPTLRVVAGDGTGDRLFARNDGSVTPAWRPGRAHVLAHLDARRRVVVADTDTARVLWRAPVRGRALQLVWSGAGDRLIVVGPRRIHLLDGRSGRVLRRSRSPARTTNGTAVADRRGRGFTLLRHRGARAEILAVDARLRARRLFAAADIAGIARSPDGRWLLVDWRQADAWLFLPLAAAHGRAREVSHIARTFAHGEPILAGWSAAPR